MDAGGGKVVVPRVKIGKTYIHLDRNLTGGSEEADICRKFHAVGSRARWGGRMGNRGSGTYTRDSYVGE